MFHWLKFISLHAHKGSEMCMCRILPTELMGMATGHLQKGCTTPCKRSVLRSTGPNFQRPGFKFSGCLIYRATDGRYIIDCLTWQANACPTTLDYGKTISRATGYMKLQYCTRTVGVHTNGASFRKKTVQVHPMSEKLGRSLSKSCPN